MHRFALWFAVGMSAVACGAFGQTYTTYVDNGPSDNRVDIVFLGDGYTEADLSNGTYADHVENYLMHMFSNSAISEPFHRYQNYFNVHLVEVVSNESGADVPPANILRDTALDATYFFDGSTDRLLSINTSKANAARDAALAGSGFSAEMQYVAVNDSRYGGSGGSYAVFAGGNNSTVEVALHEVAHSFSGLADEYGGFAGPYAGGEPREANVTTDATGDKWAHWLGYDQPGVGVIGVYEGGRYYDSGIYRPSTNSKMRSLFQPFDAVGREKIILDIYDFVDPLDSWTDNSTTLLDPGALLVDRVDDELIDLEWFVDGELIDDAGGDSFDLAEFGYDQGDFEVSVRGFDPTAFDPIDGWVRIDTTELEQYVTWNVSVTNGRSDLDGDFDLDDDVDGADFLAWQRGFGSDYEETDLTAWAMNFGAQNANNLDALTAPEPSSFTTAVLAVSMVGLSYCRSRRLARRCPA